MTDEPDKDEFVMVPRRELDEFRQRLGELEQQVRDLAEAGLPEITVEETVPSLQEQHQAFVERARAAERLRVDRGRLDLERERERREEL